jgi:hypothetical protein
VTHVAFDLALGTTGVAYPGGSDVLECPSGLDGGRRLAWWFTALSRVLRDHYEYGLTVVAERAIVHKGHGAEIALALGELHGICKLAAYNVGAGTDYVVIDNMTLKAWAKRAGASTVGQKNGLPSKAQMVDLARRLGCDPRTDDEADAFLLYTAWCDREFVRGRSARPKATRKKA